MYPQDAATSCKDKQVEDYPYSEITTSSSQSIIEARSSKALSSVLQRMENLESTCNFDTKSKGCI